VFELGSVGYTGWTGTSSIAIVVSSPLAKNDVNSGSATPLFVNAFPLWHKHVTCQR
jgi:hypothetical protein